MSRKLCPSKNSPEKDLVMTPPELAQDIVDYFSPAFICGDKFLEPCKGEGAFVSAIQKHPYIFDQGIGFIHWCELSEGIDFLEKDFCGQKYDWIITNFPFSKYADFLEKSMQVAENIITYGTVCHVLSLKKRLRLIKEAGFYIREVLLTDTPKGWNTGGFACGAIYLSKQAGDCKFTESK